MAEVISGEMAQQILESAAPMQTRQYLCSSPHYHQSTASSNAQQVLRGLEINLQSTEDLHVLKHLANMVNLASKFAIFLVVLIAILYQFVFKTLIFDTLGYGRSVSSISAFNVRCEKVDRIGLEACEDMWLHQPTGYLYMACADSESKTRWLPAYVPFFTHPDIFHSNASSVDFLNATGRGLLDRIVVIDTRGSGRLEDRVKWLSAENFPGINGDGTLNLHGFDVRVDPNTDTLRLLLINHRPPIDPVTGEALDAKIVGANSTIELFQTKAGSETMRHVRTYADELIMTPNRVAWVNDHAFVFTNDHSAKVGFVSTKFSSETFELTAISAGISTPYSAVGISDTAHAINATSLRQHHTPSTFQTDSFVAAMGSSTSLIP